MSDRYDNNSLGHNAGHAADKALGSHDEPRTTGDAVGETVGGLSGAATGAALGSLGGPIGTIIGGIAGAVSGWWSGRAISEAASSFDHDEDHYRTHHTSAGSSSLGSASMGSGSMSSASSGSMSSSSMGSSSMGASAGGYDSVRPAYQLGHLAGLNPDYHGRQFDDIEPDLRRGWESQPGDSRADWHGVRDYARAAYGRSQQRSSMGAGASALGGAMHSGMSSNEAGMSGMQDRATHSGLLDRAADKLDDFKDRVDGNPASRPGPDATDRRI
jgi:hypothetical protein